LLQTVTAAGCCQTNENQVIKLQGSLLYLNKSAFYDDICGPVSAK